MGHPPIEANEIDMKGRPGRRADKGRYGKSNGGAAVGYRPSGRDLEAKPISDIVTGGGAQGILGLMTFGFAVEIDVDRSSNTQIARHQGSRAFDDPRGILEIEV